MNQSISEYLRISKISKIYIHSFIIPTCLNNIYSSTNLTWVRVPSRGMRRRVYYDYYWGDIVKLNKGAFQLAMFDDTRWYWESEVQFVYF